ncbi:MAG: hypothetical protein ABI177_11775 [Edaphobacter sp.]
MECGTLVSRGWILRELVVTETELKLIPAVSLMGVKRIPKIEFNIRIAGLDEEDLNDASGSAIHQKSGTSFV